MPSLQPSHSRYQQHHPRRSCAHSLQRECFRVLGRYLWHDLLYFRLRLTELSRKSIREVKTSFPEIERWVGQFGEASEYGLRVLDEFTNLQVLSLDLHEDIMTRHAQLLYQLRRLGGGSCRVVLKIGGAMRYYDVGGGDNRQLRISSGSVRKMQKWGCEIRGDRELVDQNHSLRHESKGMKWLEDNRRNAVKHGWISEPTLFGWEKSMVFDFYGYARC